MGAVFHERSMTNAGRRLKQTTYAPEVVCRLEIPVRRQFIIARRCSADCKVRRKLTLRHFYHRRSEATKEAMFWRQSYFVCGIT